MRREVSMVVAVVGVLAVAATAASDPAQAGAATPKAKRSIVGGGPADFSRWPFIVALLRNGRFSCGGSVLSPTKVLTAAHCVERIAPARLTVIANRPQMGDSGTGEALGVATAVAHPD